MVRKVAHRFWQGSGNDNVSDWLRYVSGKFGTFCLYLDVKLRFDTKILRKVRESGAKAEMSKVQGSPFQFVKYVENPNLNIIKLAISILK